MSRPVTRPKIEKFTKFLKNRGAEILPVTNKYEAVRWIGSETGVLYLSGKYGNQYTETAWLSYLNGYPWVAGTRQEKRKSNYHGTKKKIVERDGCNCFYCGKPLNEDVTLEHLHSLVAGGKNTLGNSVLAHKQCNYDAENLTVAEKLNLAIKLRTQLKDEEE